MWTLVWSAGYVLLVIFCSQKKFKYIPKAKNFYAKIVYVFVFVDAESFTN